MIYSISLTKIGDTKECWGIDTNIPPHKIEQGVRHHSPFKGVSVYSFLVDTNTLKLKLGDDRLGKAFEYAKDEIRMAMIKRERSFWRDEMGKVRL